MGEGYKFNWSLRRCVLGFCDLLISYASSRFNLWPFLSTCRMDKISEDILWLVGFLLCFIVKRIPGVSQEFIYNVSPSTIFHVNQLYSVILLVVNYC